MKVIETGRRYSKTAIALSLFKENIYKMKVGQTICISSPNKDVILKVIDVITVKKDNSEVENG